MPSALKTRLKRSGMLLGLVTSIAAPEMEMLLIKQLITLPANSIAPDGGLTTSYSRGHGTGSDNRLHAILK